MKKTENKNITEKKCAFIIAQILLILNELH